MKRPKMNLPDWFKWSFNLNQWAWFHIGGGGVLAKAFLLFGCGKWSSLAFVALIAVLWEVIEYFIETDGKPENVYGSRRRWFWDSFGDVVGAILMALIVVV